MRITVLYNTNTATANDPLLKIADEDTILTATAVTNALSSLGHQVHMFDVTEKTVEEILYIDTDFYFNTCEGIGSLPKSCHLIPEKLETLDVPFSGSSSHALCLTTDKAKVKDILLKKGINTANYMLFTGDYSSLGALKFPLIVKPSSEDCSIGIDETSVVRSEIELRRKLQEIQTKYDDPLLIEEYLPGREFAVTVFGNGRNAKMLPVYEIKYSQYFSQKPRIYDYRAKWDKDSEQYREISVECPAKISDALKEQIEDTALTAFLSTHCSDYARVDIKLSASGEPNILEINANPGIGPDDETVSSAKALGISYENFLNKIVASSLKRFYNNSYEKYIPIFTSA